METGASSALFGRWGHTSVSRGLGEFQGRRPVLITAASEAVLALPVEGLDAPRLREFLALCAPALPQLIITERRALALGLDASAPMLVRRRSIEFDVAFHGTVNVTRWRHDNQPAVIQLIEDRAGR